MVLFGMARSTKLRQGVWLKQVVLVCTIGEVMVVHGDIAPKSLEGIKPANNGYLKK
jgi:hypothetical protein